MRTGENDCVLFFFLSTPFSPFAVHGGSRFKEEVSSSLDGIPSSSCLFIARTEIGSLGCDANTGHDYPHPVVTSRHGGKRLSGGIEGKRCQRTAPCRD